MTGAFYLGRRNRLDSHDPTASPAEELRYGGGKALSRPTACRFLSSRSAAEMRSGDRGDSASGGAPRVVGVKWRKWRIRAMLQNHHKKSQMLDLKSGWGPNE